MALTQKECVPCRGGIPPLSEVEAKALLEQTPGWVLTDNATKLMRKYAFKNFKTALSFVNKIGELAEAQKHHPDLKFGWGYVDVVIFTHKIGGLHENDFILAAKINALPQEA